MISTWDMITYDGRYLHVCSYFNALWTHKFSLYPDMSNVIPHLYEPSKWWSSCTFHLSSTWCCSEFNKLKCPSTKRLRIPHDFWMCTPFCIQRRDFIQSSLTYSKNSFIFYIFCDIKNWGRTGGKVWIFLGRFLRIL